MKNHCKDYANGMENISADRLIPILFWKSGKGKDGRTIPGPRSRRHHYRAWRIPCTLSGDPRQEFVISQN